jgi:hypothetical protein
LPRTWAAIAAMRTAHRGFVKRLSEWHALSVPQRTSFRNNAVA